MSEEATLQLEHDGRSNVLRIRRGTMTGVHSVVVDVCKDLPRNQDDADIDCFNRHVVNRIAQSTDFICSHTNCSYHNKSESRYILHARSHFVFEVTLDAVYDTEFKCVKGKYTCSKCPRSTTDWICFREHIRHHIFEKPYKCSLCMVAVTSVPDLRIHFQKCHVGKQSDFVFNGSVYELNTLLSLLLPDSNAVTEPLNISFKLPVNMTTRISCTSVLDRTHALGLMQHVLIDNRKRAKQRELSAAGAGVVVDHNCVVKRLPGKYDYNRGIYNCITCSYGTSKEVAFLRHVWKHVHGSWKSSCTHNTNGITSSQCAVVNGLIDMLKRVELTRVIDSLRKNSASETVANTHSHASEALGNESTENSKYIYFDVV